VQIGSALAGIAAGRDGRAVYVASADDDRIAIIDTIGNRVVGTIPVGHRPSGIAIHGDVLYCADAADDQVEVIALTDRNRVGTLAVGHDPGGLAVTPGGTYVYVVNRGDGSVSVIATATSAVRATVKVGAGASGFGGFAGGRAKSSERSFSEWLALGAFAMGLGGFAAVRVRKEPRPKAAPQ